MPHRPFGSACAATPPSPPCGLIRSYGGPWIWSSAPLPCKARAFFLDPRGLVACPCCMTCLAIPNECKSLQCPLPHEAFQGEYQKRPPILPTSLRTARGPMLSRTGSRDGSDGLRKPCNLCNSNIQIQKLSTQLDTWKLKLQLEASALVQAPKKPKGNARNSERSKHPSTGRSN